MEENHNIKDSKNNSSANNKGGKKKKIIQYITKHINKQWLIIATATAGVILIAASGLLVWQLIFRPPEQAPETAPVAITDISQLVNQTKEQQGDFALSDVKISRTGAKNVVTAKLKYAGEGTANARVSFILRNTGNGQLQGRKYEKIENLSTGEEREIEIAIVGDFERSTAYEVGVEKI